MPGPAHSVYGVADVRAIERRAIEEYGLPESELMERAGAAAFAVLKARWPDARTIVVVCGPGNNGGDGRVVARLAKEDGMTVHMVDPGHRGSGTPYRDGGVSLPTSDLIVDALLGIGLSRPPEGEFAALIDAINAHPAPVLSLDIPSGLNSDCGSGTPYRDGDARHTIRADVTVTFITYKRGLFTGAGPGCCGMPVLATLGVPDEAFAGVLPVAAVLPPNLAADLLGPRRRDAHKGDSGHVLVIGGNRGMAGAARLAGEAALRCGAGLVSIAVAPGMATTVASGRPELMVHEVDDVYALEPLLARSDVVALGPGLGTDPWAQQIAACALGSEKPLVADADALNLLAQHPLRRDNWIVTPHPGEAARLLGTSAAEVQADRFGALGALVEATGAVVVLKGACTLVGAPRVVPQVCTTGNPGMAAGGMGDLLTGVVAALCAQGLDLSAAAAAGAVLHAEAGDRAALLAGERGLLASDLLLPLHWRVNGRE